MAYKLIWSPAARDDLHDIVVFIAAHNLNRAMSFGYELISRLTAYKNSRSWGGSCPNTEGTTFAKSFFGPIESCTGSIMRPGFVRLHVFGTQPAEFHSCNDVQTKEVAHRRTDMPPFLEVRSRSYTIKMLSDYAPWR